MKKIEIELFDNEVELVQKFIDYHREDHGKDRAINMTFEQAIRILALLALKDRVKMD